MRRCGPGHRPSHDAHRRDVQIPLFAASGPEVLAKRRAAGDDPAHGGRAGKKRAESQAKRAQERREWEAKHRDGQAEREYFIREIQPKLAGIPLSRIIEATGFSLRYAALVRSGEYVPHPVHYDRLVLLSLTEDQPVAARSSDHSLKSGERTA